MAPTLSGQSRKFQVSALVGDLTTRQFTALKIYGGSSGLCYNIFLSISTQNVVAIFHFDMWMAFFLCANLPQLLTWYIIYQMGLWFKQMLKIFVCCKEWGMISHFLITTMTSLKVGPCFPSYQALIQWMESLLFPWMYSLNCY